jgi:predicted GH43/DUF377 family glycosyl hydrolase
LVYNKIIEVSKTNLLPGDFHFNSSIIRYNGDLLLAYRWDQVDPTIEKWISHSNISIVICKLDNDYQPIPNTNVILGIPKLFDDNGNAKHEDPRLFVYQDDLYCSYTVGSLSLQLKKQPFASVGVCKLDKNLKVIDNWWFPYGNNLSIDGSPLYPNVERLRGFEKNWTLFEHDSKLLGIYCIDPHQVLEFNVKDNSAKLISDTRSALNWNYGIPRGGTPPIRIDDMYFTFFHSSYRYRNPQIFPHPVYVMGAYGFETTEPYRIRKISKIPILVGDIHDYICSTAVAFPCGAIYEDGKWIVSYGHNDFATRVVEIQHDKLLASLVDI